MEPTVNPNLKILTKHHRQLEGAAAIEYAKKNGLCTSCGIFQTHEKGKRTFLKGSKMEPMTVINNRGVVTVYKGFCISATCYQSVDQVKEILGELSPRRTRHSTYTPSDTSTARPSSDSAVQVTRASTLSMRNYAPPVPSQRPRHSAPSALSKRQSTTYISHLPTHLSPGGVNQFSPSPSRKSIPQSIDEIPSHLTRPPLTTEDVAAMDGRGNHNNLQRDDSLRLSGFLDDTSKSRSSGFDGSNNSSGGLRYSGTYSNHIGSLPTAQPPVFSHRDEPSDFPRSPQTPNRKISSEHPVLLEFRSALFDADYVRFLNGFEQRANDPDLIVEGFRIFRKRLVHDQALRGDGVVLAGNGWVKAVWGKLEEQRFRQDKEVLECILATLLTLSNLPGTYKTAMVRKGICDKLFKVIDDFPADEEIVALVCSLIASLSSTEKDGLNGKYDGVAKVIRKLVDLLVSNDQVGRQYSLVPLSNLSKQRKIKPDTGRSPWYDVRDLLSTEQTTQAMIEIAHAADTEMRSIESIFSLLWRLSVPRAKHVTENPLPIGEDLVNCILDTMGRFKTYNLVLTGCGILANLALRIQFPMDLAQPAVRSINQFLTDRSSKVDEKMAINAIHAFCNFLANSATRPTILSDPQFLQSSLSLLIEFPNCEALVEVACLAIAHATVNDQDRKDLILNLGGLELLRNAFNQFVKFDEGNYSMEVKDSIFCAIAALSGCEAVARQISETSFLVDIQEVLEFETDKDFQSVLEVIVNNVDAATSEGFGSEINTRAPTDLRQQPGLFSFLLPTAESEDHVLNLLMDLNELGEAGIEAYGNEGFDALLVAMDQYINNPSIQEQGCRALVQAFFYLPFNNLDGPTQLPTGGWAVIYREQSVITIQNSMLGHSDNTSVLKQGICALSNFLSRIACALEEYSPERFHISQWLEAGMDVILNTLNANATDDSFQKPGLNLLWAIFSICTPESLQRCKIRALQHIFDSMSIMQDNPDVLMVACDALMGLEGDTESVNFMGESIILQLINMLSLKNVEVVSRASGVLAVLCKQVDTACMLTFKTPNALHNIILCMDENQSTSKIQTNACCVLEALIKVEDYSIRALMVQNGALYSVCDALLYHGNEPVLVENACRVLSFIIPSTDPNTIASMRKNLGDALVGVMNMLIDLQSHHQDSGEAESAVLDALYTCCSQDEYFKHILVNGNSLSIVVDIMTSKLGSAQVQRSGCSLLWILSGYGHGKEVIGASGGVAAVVNALLAHNESEDVQKEGLAALKNLATATNNKQAIFNQSGEDAVLYALWIHYKNSQVISIAYSALNNIAVDSETRTVRQMNERAFENAVSSLSRFPNDEAVQKNICFFLKSCSYLPGNLEIICGHAYQLIPLLQEAAVRFPQQCHDRAMSVIGKIQQFS